MALTRRALLVSALSGGAWSALGQIQPGAVMTSLGGFAGDRLRRNISQWLKTFDIHRHVGLIETGHGAGAGLVAGRWLAASVRATEWSGDAFLRQRASAMLDRILGAAKAEGRPFPEMTRADEVGMGGALETIAELWFNGPAREVADRMNAGESDARRGLDANAVVRLTGTERLNAVVTDVGRVLARTGDGVWGDVTETLLWNQVFGCQTFEGDGFLGEVPFYGALPALGGDKAATAGALMLSRVPWMFYAVERDRVWVHQYAPSEVSLQVGGSGVRLAQVTSFPEEEEVAVEIRSGGGEFELRLRMPGWCSMPAAQVNGTEVTGRPAKGYLGIRRKWARGDRVTLRFPMEPRWMRVQTGQYELRRGPVLYCVRVEDGVRVRLENPAQTAAAPAKFGPAYRLRVILETRQESNALAEPFAFAAWGGPYRTAVQAE